MIRQNRDITEKKEVDIVQLRGDYEAAREMNTLKDHGGWVRIKTILEANLGTLRNQLDEFHTLNEHGIRFILKEIQDFEFFIDLVEKAEQRLGELATRISRAEAELNERKRTEK